MLAVRGILFDKTPDENWPVAWHQDLSIAVAARVELGGYSGWSVKGSVPHVQAPVELLERMVTLRLHLDDVGVDNGRLRIAPGTHRKGRIASAEIAGQVAACDGEVVFTAPAGDALLLKPLVLHGSARATSVAHRHRRVIHIEFAPTDGLAAGLEWHERNRPC